MQDFSERFTDLMQEQRALRSVFPAPVTTVEVVEIYDHATEPRESNIYLLHDALSTDQGVDLVSTSLRNLSDTELDALKEQLTQVQTMIDDGINHWSDLAILLKQEWQFRNETQEEA